MSIGKNIKKLRVVNGLTQEELGKKLNVTDKTISSWEVDRTEPNMGMVNKMSQIFKCELTTIIGTAETVAAHHDGEYWTEEELQAIEDFKEFVKSKRNKK